MYDSGMVNGYVSVVPIQRVVCAWSGAFSDGAYKNPGVEDFEGVLLCERYAMEVEARERKEQWEEVDFT